MTLGTIHDLNKRIPNNNIQYALSVFGFLLGVFSLAIIIGEVSGLNVHCTEAETPLKKWGGGLSQKNLYVELNNINFLKEKRSVN